MTGRIVLAFLVVSVMAWCTTAFVRAEGTGEVTLKGKLACAKCMLHETAQCQNVLQVKDGDKSTSYYLTDNATSKECHGAVCHEAKDGVSVTGAISEKDGKHWLTASKIEGLPKHD